MDNIKATLYFPKKEGRNRRLPKEKLSVPPLLLE